jgi:uncharacterized protein YcfL
MKKLMMIAALTCVLLAGCGAAKPKPCSDDYAATLGSNPCGPKLPINTDFTIYPRLHIP